MPTKTTKKRLSDLDFITSPLLWPRWPTLPLIHRTRMPYEKGYCGFLMAGEPVVYLGSIWGHSECKTWEDVIRRLPFEGYESYSDVLKEWRID